MFKLIVLLNPDFNYCSSFVLSLVDRVTTRTWSFVSVIVNAPALVESGMLYFADQVDIKIISQLNRGHFKSYPKVTQSFNHTAISTFFVLPAAGVLPIILALNLNDSESVMLSFGSSFWYFHKLANVFE